MFSIFGNIIKATIGVTMSLIGLLLAYLFTGIWLKGMFIAFIFASIGLFVVKSAVTQLSIDFKTQRVGQDCFAKIIGQDTSSVFVNGTPFVLLELAVYEPDDSIHVYWENTYQCNPDKFPIGSFLKVRVHDGDTNIQQIQRGVFEAKPPIEIINSLDSFVPPNDDDDVVE